MRSLASPTPLKDLDPKALDIPVVLSSSSALPVAAQRASQADHEVFHLLFIAGVAAHFLAISLYAVPSW